MKYGYARTSTAKQDYGLEDQVEKLEAYGCAVIRKEQVSSVGKRPEFEIILDFIQEGDSLVVTTLSRFARSIKIYGLILSYWRKKVRLWSFLIWILIHPPLQDGWWSVWLDPYRSGKERSFWKDNESGSQKQKMKGNTKDEQTPRDARGVRSWNYTNRVRNHLRSRENWILESHLSIGIEKVSVRGQWTLL